MNIEVSQNELTLIVEALQHELNESHSEVRRTQTSTYRDDLKKREREMRELHARLSEVMHV